MVKHNNSVPNIHLRKHWQRRTHTHFDQAAQKLRRRQRRETNASRNYPRPSEALRPVVSSQTRKYAGKVRYGRGFTLAELKQAKLTARFARTVGISVDHRRTNTSQEQLTRNVDRLNMYKEKLILFPRREGKPKKGLIADSVDTAASKNCSQGDGNAPIAALPAAATFAPITAEMKNAKAFFTLREARTNMRYKGRREKRIADEEAAKK